MGRLIRAAVAVLLCYAVWQTGAVYWQFLQLQDRLERIAQASVELGDDAIRAAVVREASDLGVDLDPERVGVRFGENNVAINAAYTTRIRALPWWSVPWTFTLEARAWLIPSGGLRNKGGSTRLRAVPAATISSPA